jgi:hemolysin-activating ACP:hemolysin acyltransferase
VIARDIASNGSKEYKTNDISLSTVDWTAGEYWICVQAIAPGAESECDSQFARVFEKLPTVKFYMDSNVEEIIWDPIVVSDPARKIDYVVKAWIRATDKITDFPANGRKFSTSSWDDGEYWICVQAIAPGAESSCDTYWGYTIDRKAIADRAAAELKAKQEAEAELLAKQEAEAELLAKQEAEAKAAAELKAKQEAANKKKTITTKKSTITCVKGKLIKRVTAVKPKCPPGYRVKK